MYIISVLTCVVIETFETLRRAANRIVAEENHAVNVKGNAKRAAEKYIIIFKKCGIHSVQHYE